MAKLRWLDGKEGRNILDYGKGNMAMRKEIW